MLDNLKAIGIIGLTLCCAALVTKGVYIVLDTAGLWDLFYRRGGSFVVAAVALGGYWALTKWTDKFKYQRIKTILMLIGLMGFAFWLGKPER